MTGTPRRTARLSGVTQNPKEGAGKLLGRGTRIAYEWAQHIYRRGDE